MKKNFKFMLSAVLAVFGLSSASAQELHAGSTVTDAYYQYTLLDAPVETAPDKYTANVELTKVRDGKNPVVSNAIYMPTNGVFTSTYGSEEYTFTLTQISATAPLKNLDLATTVTIPATIKALPEECFKGCSAMTSITFAPNSQVETIGRWAFATTKITEFNFSPCVKLAGLPDEVFVQPGLKNSYIKKVTLPTGALFKHINGAFKNLIMLGDKTDDETNVGIYNLENSYVEEIIAKAFDGCAKLEKLSLPGNNLKTIDPAALEGSSVKDLSIDVSSLLTLGSSAATTNLYNQATTATLTKLTLTGTLKGKICKNAFLGCTGLAGVLDFEGMTFGSTGQIEGNAFDGCTAVTGVKIGNIANNATGGYTIAENAFVNCTALVTVSIQNISAVQAVGKKAFGNNLKDVTIGSVITSDKAFEAGAFVWGNNSESSLNLATGSGQYLSQTSADGSKPVFVAGAFDFSAVTGGSPFVFPAITIGTIESKGGVFAAGAIIPAKAAFSAFKFIGNIATKGIDTKIVDVSSTTTNITALEFGKEGVNTTIETGGIATGAFAGETAITTVTFWSLLKEAAVASGAFYAVGSPAVSSITDLYYKKTGITDYYVNPFAKDAFDCTGTADASTPRTIKFNVSDGNLAKQYEDLVKGLGTNGAFDVYLAVFYKAPDPTLTAFRVYRNGTTTLAWGRYDLGKFAIEKGPDDAYTATDMAIPRYATAVVGKGEDQKEFKVKLTLYGSYTDENEDAIVAGKTDPGESLVYMVPLKVYGGKYYLKNTNARIIIVKAEIIQGTLADTDKDFDVLYTVPTSPITDEQYACWSTLPNYGTAKSFRKNTTGNVITTQILWDKTNAAYDVWGGDPDHTLAYAPKAIYSLSNPANYKGCDVVKVLVSETSGKIGLNWYYTFLRHFGDTGSAARVIWMGEEEATAIFGVKENAKVAAEDGVMYNLQGVRISAPAKGQLYIMNGKKYIGK